MKRHKPLPHHKMRNFLLSGTSSKYFEISDLDPPKNPTSHYGACHFEYNLTLKGVCTRFVVEIWLITNPSVYHSNIIKNLIFTAIFLYSRVSYLTYVFTSNLVHPPFKNLICLKRKMYEIRSSRENV